MDINNRLQLKVTEGWSTPDCKDKWKALPFESFVPVQSQLQLISCLVAVLLMVYLQSHHSFWSIAAPTGGTFLLPFASWGSAAQTGALSRMLVWFRRPLLTRVLWFLFLFCNGQASLKKTSHYFYFSISSLPISSPVQGIAISDSYKVLVVPVSPLVV